MHTQHHLQTFLVREKFFFIYIDKYDIQLQNRETKVKHSHQQGNLGSKERLCPAQKQQNKNQC